jgi:glycerophosphoryl diester phosphodiesterase
MGRDVEGTGDAFYGDAAPIERIRRIYPEAWAFTEEETRACTVAYLKVGWFGITPEECEGGTISIPINRQWLFAGWPNKLIARMEAVGARVLILGPHGQEGAGLGIDLPEQLGDIPNTFNGYVMVDDIQAIGPALHPSLNKRRPMEEEALAKTLQARRERRE